MTSGKLLNTRTFFLTIFLTSAIAGFSGCSGKDYDPNPNPNPNPNPTPGKTAKFTISTVGLSPTDSDNVTLSITGSMKNGLVGDMWKVDGIVKPGEAVIVIGKAQLTAGNPVVIESVNLVDTMAVTLAAGNIGPTFILKFKSEINGKTKEDMNATVVPDIGFRKDWSY